MIKMTVSDYPLDWESNHATASLPGVQVELANVAHLHLTQEMRLRGFGGSLDELERF